MARDTLVGMKISADFTVIPDDFAKAAAPEYFNGGVPVVSFPFYIDDVNPEARYLHWEFVDPDSIPVCGFEWIHWSVANLPIGALMGKRARVIGTTLRSRPTEDKREILADDKLEKIFGGKKATMFEMNKHLAKHLKA